VLTFNINYTIYSGKLMKNSCLKFLQADKGKFCQEKFVSIIQSQIRVYEVSSLVFWVIFECGCCKLCSDSPDLAFIPCFFAFSTHLNCYSDKPSYTSKECFYL
jgi:hypothetical protein